MDGYYKPKHWSCTILKHSREASRLSCSRYNAWRWHHKATERRSRCQVRIPPIMLSAIHKSSKSKDKDARFSKLLSIKLADSQEKMLWGLFNKNFWEVPTFRFRALFQHLKLKLATSASQVEWGWTGTVRGSRAYLEMAVLWKLVFGALVFRFPCPRAHTLHGATTSSYKDMFWSGIFMVTLSTIPKWSLWYSVGIKKTVL